MTDRTPNLFAAIYTARAADSTIQTLLGGPGRVFNGVGANQAAPFVDIGETTAVDYSSSSGDAQEHTITVHVWTEQTAGVKSARAACIDLVAQVRAVLHDSALEISAGLLPNLRCEYTETMRDPDGISWHGVLRFRAVTQT